MPYRFNPLARFGFDYYEVSTGGEAGTGTGWSGEVTDYTYLPAASSHTGEVWLATQASGVWPFKKKPGFYRSAGGAWVWLGFNTLTSLADVPTLPDSTNDYRLASIAGTFTWSPELTPAQKGAAGEVRQVTGPAVDGLPDTATQAKIDQLLSAGWPDYSILWRPTVVTYPSASLNGVSVTTSVGTITGVGSAAGVAALTGVSATTSVADITGLGLGAGVAALTGASVTTSVADIIGAPNTSLPTTPTISVTPGDTQNVIALTGGGVGATSYDIHWGTSMGSRPNVIDWATIQAATNPDFPATAFTHTGRTNGTQYFYSLVATNGAGSVESAEASGVPAVQPVSYIGASTVQTIVTTGSDQINFAPGIADGDLLIIAVGGSIMSSTPAGWTSDDSGSGYFIHKIATGLDVTTGHVMVDTYPDTGEGGLPMVMRCFAFRPVNATTPIDGVSVSNASGTSVSLPAITTTLADDLMVGFIVSANSLIVSSVSGDYISHVDANTGTGSIVMVYGSQSSAGVKNATVNFTTAVASGVSYKAAYALRK